MVSGGQGLLNRPIAAIPTTKITVKAVGPVHLVSRRAQRFRRQYGKEPAGTRGVLRGRRRLAASPQGLGFRDMGSVRVRESQYNFSVYEFSPHGY